MPKTQPPIQLTGMAWDHSRALPPLVATAQRYEETHDGVRIHWHKRTLDEFGHMPINVLAEKFDLIVIDHPWAGLCLDKNWVCDLAQILPAPVLDDFRENSVGPSFDSYYYQDKLLAVPIDAAAPAPSWRPDLLARHEVQPPQTWAEAVALSRRGLAVFPGFDADLFLHWVMLAKALGAGLFADEDRIAPREIMQEAIGMLRELSEPMPREIFGLNPIMVAERMTRTDDFAWSAFGYTYNNYARPGFAAKSLRFGSLPALQSGGPRLRGVIGGTGIAISSYCQNFETALDYALFVAAGSTQKGIYVHAGGQPWHRAAWDDPFANLLCGNFFNDTRQTQSEAFVRPRYSGYVPLQTEGGQALQACLRDGADLDATLDKLDALYRASRARGCQTN